MERGEYDEALRRFETMIEACARINNKRGVAHGLMKIGQIKRLTGDYESATDAFARSLELYESLADKRLIATVLGHIGLVNWNRGEFDEAMNCFREEAECMKTIGDTNGYAIAAGKIGLVELDRGDLEKAAQSFNEYLKITSELGYSRGIGFACGDLGLVALQQSRFDDANAYFDKALAIHRGIEFPEGTSMWLRWKTEASLLRGDVSESAGSWNAECIEIATLIGKSDVLFDADVQRYRLAHALGKHAEAIAGLRQLSDVHLNEVQQAEINYWLWKLTDENELPLRSEHKKRAAELYRSLGDRSGKSLYRKRLSELSDQADDH